MTMGIDYYAVLHGPFDTGETDTSVMAVVVTSAGEIEMTFDNFTEFYAFHASLPLQAAVIHNEH